MSTHPLRRLLHTAGIDVRRYRKEPEPFSYFATLGIRTVIDVGANIGQFAKEIKNVLPEARVYSFEPLKDCFAMLTASMKSKAHFHAFNIALGDTAGTSTIYRSPYSPSSSLLKMTSLHESVFPHTAGKIEEIIRVERLDDVVKSLTLTSPLLIKLDVQGYEDKVLRGGPETLTKATAVLVEVSFVTLYEKQPLFDDLYTIFRKNGFSYSGAIHQKLDQRTGKILFGDALFVRNGL